MPTEPETVTARIALTIAGTRLEADLTVPTAPARLTEVLPVLQVLSDAVIGAVVKSVEAEGRTVSCRKGCAACCRQLVPVSEAEAWQIRDLVESLPEPRRSAVRARFAEAIRRLDAAGLLGPLRGLAARSDAQRQALGREYFAEHLACPFLEEELCSIFPGRPFVCREYLVTSPPELCDDPMGNALAGVQMPVQIWPVVSRLGDDAPGPVRIVPLVLALEWAADCPDTSVPRPTPEWVQGFFEKLSGRPIPVALPGMMGSAGVPG